MGEFIMEEIGLILSRSQEPFETYSISLKRKKNEIYLLRFKQKKHSDISECF